MGNFTAAVFLPKETTLEEAYHNVIGEEDNIEFDYLIENSNVFRESYIAYQETYVEWFNTKPDKIKEDIVSLIGFTPVIQASKAYISSIYLTKVVSCKDYYDRLLYADKTKDYSEFYIPVSFIVDNVYYEHCLDYCIVTDLDQNVTNITEPNYYENIFLDFLRENKDRLVVICKCRT